MHYSAFFAAAALAVQPALGDFLIFAGAENQFPDPVQSGEFLFFNNPPSCKDITSGAIVWNSQFYNDASHGGLACDGCDASKAPQDWDIKRLEMYDDNSSTFSYDKAHFTLYKQDSGGWDMIGTDQPPNLIGHCDKIDNPQIATCQDVGSVDNLAGIIHCVTPMNIRNSN